MGDALQSLTDFAQNLFYFSLEFGLRRGDFGRLNVLLQDGTSDRGLEPRPGHLHEAEFHFHLSRDNLAAFEIVRSIPPDRQRLFLLWILLNIFVRTSAPKPNAADRQMHMRMGLVSVRYGHPLMTLQPHPLNVPFGRLSNDGVARILVVRKAESVVHDWHFWLRPEAPRNAELAGQFQSVSSNHIAADDGGIFTPHEEVVKQASEAASLDDVRYHESASVRSLLTTSDCSKSGAIFAK
ncbi:MAG: hypothetical protein Q8O00_15310 [Holophaga sp.]|nr:hypothetical protein [Holophaga sp.]